MATQQIGVAGLTKEARLWYETVLQGRNVPDFLHGPLRVLSCR